MTESNESSFDDHPVVIDGVQLCNDSTRNDNLWAHMTWHWRNNIAGTDPQVTEICQHLHSAARADGRWGYQDLQQGMEAALQSMSNRSAGAHVTGTWYLPCSQDLLPPLVNVTHIPSPPSHGIASWMVVPSRGANSDEHGLHGDEPDYMQEWDED